MLDKMKFDKKDDKKFLENFIEIHEKLGKKMKVDNITGVLSMLNNVSNENLNIFNDILDNFCDLYKKTGEDKAKEYLNELISKNDKHQYIYRLIKLCF